MLGDPRYRQLYDYDAFVWSSLLDTPKGWANLQAYLSDLASALDALHSDREHSSDQSLRHGRQTVDILRQPHPALRALPEALDGPIRKRLTELGSGEDPVRSRNSGEYALQGLRSAKVHPGGDAADEVHAHGWLSSTCHVGTLTPKRKEGWIKFGQPGIKTLPPLEPEHFVEPEPGLLVLFPSYMWHGAVPLAGETPRLTFAFDLVPAPDTSEDK
jgi:hypothetical protein